MTASTVADGSSYSTMFSTRLFMPGWWVRAFDTAVLTPRDPQMNAIDVAWHMQVLPALDIPELNALAAIISELQEQLLLQGDERLRIDPSHFEKHASTTNRSRVYAFAKVLQWLPALRLLVDEPNKLQAIPLFAKEQWLKEEDHLTLELSLYEIGAELLLGYGCSHLELLRQAEGKQTSAALLGEFAPLGFWRSAWMELQGVEQAFLVRLEKAMQWESRWLHFDGIFGKSLGELMQGLELRIPKRQLETRKTRLSQVHWLLEKIGRKLFHQGLLRLEVEDEYLALTDNYDRGTQLVWQVTAQKAVMAEVERYQNDCMRFLLQSRLGPRLSSLGRLFGAGDRLSEIMTVGRILVGGVTEELLQPLAGVATSTPVLPIPTFLEWHLRLQPGHSLPLPAALIDSEPAKIARTLQENVGQQCIAFTKAIMSSLDLRESFQRMPETSISQMSAWQKPEVKDYLKRMREQIVTSPVRKPVAEVKPEAVKEKEVPTETQKSPRTVSEQKLAPVRQSINLRRLANDELKKLREHEPQRYRDLKQAYLDNLDDDRRKLILDLQGRVSPEHFDNHLRGSLVKYMIENPSMWKSAGAGGGTVAAP